MNTSPQRPWRARTALFGLGAALFGLFGLFACSGAPAAAPAQPGPAGGAQGATESASANDQDARRQAALAALRQRQDAVCEQSAEPVFQCAVEDAQRNLSPEEFAKLGVEQLKPEHRRQYLADCRASEMSLRQVEVYERCLADTACETFLPCLDQAQPQPSSESSEPSAPAS